MIESLTTTDMFEGFDTASSIALLAVSAIAKKGADAKRIPPAYVVILPVGRFLLFHRLSEDGTDPARLDVIHSRDDIA